MMRYSAVVLTRVPWAPKRSAEGYFWSPEINSVFFNIVASYELYVLPYFYWDNPQLSLRRKVCPKLSLSRKVGPKLSSGRKVGPKLSSVRKVGPHKKDWRLTIRKTCHWTKDWQLGKTYYWQKLTIRKTYHWTKDWQLGTHVTDIRLTIRKKY